MKDKESKKPFIIIFTMTSVLFFSLFITFLILWLNEKRKKCTLNRVRPDNKIQPFKLDGDNILVSFSKSYMLMMPENFVFEFTVEPYTEGVIASNRIGKRGWMLEIDSNRKLVFHSDSKRVESRDIEMLNEKHTYRVIYYHGVLRLLVIFLPLLICK